MDAASRRGGSRWARTFLAALLLWACAGMVPDPAAGFGTVEGGGQHREHEHLTRAALACADGRDRGDDCLEPRSVDQLAGDGTGFGAVGAPDRTEVSIPAAHCDDADFLAGDYPRTRDEATESLLACVDHLRRRFLEAVEAAPGLLDEQGRIAAGEVGLDSDCVLDAQREERAKCTVLESFGRALHGVQDFYAHSTWTDQADPARPIGPDNPPGLGRRAPSPVLDLRGTGVPAVPRDLTTGCFVLRDQVAGVGPCAQRITHATLNKDNGLIDAVSGGVTSPATPRGKVGRNFENAVAGAIVETRHQWREFRVALGRAYGAERAALMACALLRDDPPNDCRASGGSRARTVVVLSLGVLILLGLGAGWFRKRAGRAASPYH